MGSKKEKVTCDTSLKKYDLEECLRTAKTEIEDLCHKLLSTIMPVPTFSILFFKATIADTDEVHYFDDDDGEKIKDFSAHLLLFLNEQLEKKRQQEPHDLDIITIGKDLENIDYKQLKKIKDKNQDGILQLYDNVLVHALTAKDTDNFYFELGNVKVGDYNCIQILKLSKSWVKLFAPLESYAAHNEVPPLLRAMAVELRRSVNDHIETKTKILIVKKGRIKSSAFLADIAATFLSLITVSGESTDLYSIINEISVTSYEKKECVSRISICSGNFDSLKYMVKFKDEIKVEEIRKSRKLLQLVGDDSCLVTDGKTWHGVCRLKDVQDEPVAPFNYLVNFTRRAAWNIEKDGATILKYEDGKITIPYFKVELDNKKDLIKKTLNLGKGYDAAVLKIIKKAHAAGHGSILVFTEEAEAEADRFKIECTRVDDKSSDIKADDISSLSAMDGAVLFNCYGTCYALGVILDGPAAKGALASRGSRYNSALRYYRQKQEQGKTILVVVISDDGMIDFFPDGAIEAESV